jgi:hypothetical protein
MAEHTIRREFPHSLYGAEFKVSRRLILHQDTTLQLAEKVGFAQKSFPQGLEAQRICNCLRHG